MVSHSSIYAYLNKVLAMLWIFYVDQFVENVTDGFSDGWSSWCTMTSTEKTRITYQWPDPSLWPPDGCYVPDLHVIFITLYASLNSGTCVTTISNSFILFYVNDLHQVRVEDFSPPKPYLKMQFCFWTSSIIQIRKSRLHHLASFCEVLLVRGRNSSKSDWTFAFAHTQVDPHRLLLVNSAKMRLNS